MRGHLALLTALGVALSGGAAHALPRRAVELAAAVIETQHRIATRRHTVAGEADELASKLAQLAATVPEARLSIEPELVAFLQKGYAFLSRVSSLPSAKAVESERRFRDLLGGEEREIVKREIGGATVVLRGVPSSREIALTFDDGPCAGDGQANGTSAVLDVLREEGAFASFFVCGQTALGRPDLMQRIAAEGHTIGNHTRSHARLKGLAELSEAAIRDEVDTGESQILQAIGTDEPLIFFRCPYGSGVKSPRVNQILAAGGFYNVYWTIDTNDWKTHSSVNSVRRVLGNPNLNGAIVLLHERVAGTATAVRRIIRALKPKGYRFVSLVQLIGVDNESSARVAYREAAGQYVAGDKAGAIQRFVDLSEKERESVLADDALHHAWLIAMEIGGTAQAARIRDRLQTQFPKSPYAATRLDLAGGGPAGATLGE